MKPLTLAGPGRKACWMHWLLIALGQELGLEVFNFADQSYVKVTGF